MWLICQYYWPETTGSGLTISRLAEGLAHNGPTSVICGYPGYGGHSGSDVAASERRHGVDIHRCRGTPYRQRPLVVKLLNLVTTSLHMALRAARLVRPGETVLLVVAPPFSLWTVGLALWLRGRPFHVRIEDVYPDVLEVSGAVRKNGLVSRVWRAFNRFFLKRAQRVVVLGRDMQARIAHQLNDAEADSIVIPNAADLDHIGPPGSGANPVLEELGLDEKFVVKHSGHLGRTHNVEGMVEAARILTDAPDVHLLFIGEGPKRGWLEEAIARDSIPNITVRGYLPRSEIAPSLAAGNVSLVALVEGMSGVSVPSRIYDLLAAGQPIIAMVDASSEAARIVAEERVGWVIAPDDVAGLVEAIRAARADPMGLQVMAERARAVAVNKYGPDAVVAAYERLFALSGESLRQPTARRAGF